MYTCDEKELGGSARMSLDEAIEAGILDPSKVKANRRLDDGTHAPATVPGYPGSAPHVPRPPAASQGSEGRVFGRRARIVAERLLKAWL